MQYARLSAPVDGAGYPCRAQGACAPGCSRSRNSPTDDGGAFPPTPRLDGRNVTDQLEHLSAAVGESPRGGTARRYCPRRADPKGRCESSPLRKIAAGSQGGSLSRSALPVPSPARISVPSALLQWLRWARNPPFLNPPFLSHKR